MKKLLTILLLTASATAMAHGPHGYGHWRHHHSNNWNWVVPAVVGGVVVYEMTRPPVVVQPTPPVVVQQPVVIQGQNCGPWTQVQNPDGSITTTRTCTQ